jgi:hypothetical protein
MGAREVIAPQEDPAPSGGRMSEGQEGGCYPLSSTFAKGSSLYGFFLDSEFSILPFSTFTGGSEVKNGE